MAAGTFILAPLLECKPRSKTNNAPFVVMDLPGLICSVQPTFQKN
jgi:hypothetical protein